MKRWILISLLFSTILSAQQVIRVNEGYVLINSDKGVGKVDEIVDLFKSAPDFQQDLARYQVRHISGEFGSGKKYSVPACATLQTNHLCRAGDDRICQWVNHPLAYYRAKLRYRPKPKSSKNQKQKSPSKTQKETTSNTKKGGTKDER